MKILILVLSSDTYPSKRNKRAIKETWAKNRQEGVRIIFYSAGSDNKLIGNELTVKSGLNTSDIGYKTIKAFEWCKENLEFDFIFRTNTSSYIDIENLVNYINLLQSAEEYIYHGLIASLPKNENREKIDFVSGAGILFNKNVIELLVKNKDNINFDEWDDVALALFLKKYNIYPTEGKRFDIKGNIFKLKIDKSFYHFRCRIDNYYNYPRFLEYYVIHELHNKLKDIETRNFVKALYSFMFEISKILYIQQPFWKLYGVFKKVIKLFLPKKIFKFLKNFFEKNDESIKLRYLKK